MESFRCCPVLRKRGKPHVTPTPITSRPRSKSPEQFPGRLKINPPGASTPPPYLPIVPSSPVAESSPLAANRRPIYGSEGLLGANARPSLSRFTRSSTSDISHFSISHSARAEVQFVARDIWTTAYTSLREETQIKPLFDNYESFFNTVLWPGSLGSVSNTTRSCKAVLIPARGFG